MKECSTHPTAKEAAALFIQLVVRAHGVPKEDNFGSRHVIRERLVV